MASVAFEAEGQDSAGLGTVALQCWCFRETADRAENSHKDFARYEAIRELLGTGPEVSRV